MLPILRIGKEDWIMKGGMGKVTAQFTFQQTKEEKGNIEKEKYKEKGSKNFVVYFIISLMSFPLMSFPYSFL